MGRKEWIIGWSIKFTWFRTCKQKPLHRKERRHYKQQRCVLTVQILTIHQVIRPALQDSRTPFLSCLLCVQLVRTKLPWSLSPPAYYAKRSGILDKPLCCPITKAPPLVLRQFCPLMYLERKGVRIIAVTKASKAKPNNFSQNVTLVVILQGNGKNNDPLDRKEPCDLGKKVNGRTKYTRSKQKIPMLPRPRIKSITAKLIWQKSKKPRCTVLIACSKTEKYCLLSFSIDQQSLFEWSYLFSSVD